MRILSMETRRRAHTCVFPQMHANDHTGFKPKYTTSGHNLFFLTYYYYYYYNSHKFHLIPAYMWSGAWGDSLSGAFPSPRHHQCTQCIISALRLCFCLHGFCLMPTPNIRMHVRARGSAFVFFFLSDPGMFLKHCVCAGQSRPVFCWKKQPNTIVHCCKNVPWENDQMQSYLRV